MIKIGLTGNIGSGKTTIAKVFSSLGIPVYYADVEAKRIMSESQAVKKFLIANLGEKAFDEHGRADRGFLANRLFSDPKLLESLNQILHPLVYEDFHLWTEQFETPFVLLEAAVLFESGGKNELDQIILVRAPEELRLKRVMERDGDTKDNVIKRMKLQIPEEQKIDHSDFVIVNDGVSPVIPIVVQIHYRLIQIAQQY